MIVPPAGLVTFKVNFCPSNGVQVPGAFNVKVPVALATIFAIPYVQFGVMLVAVETELTPIVPVPPLASGNVPVTPPLEELARLDADILAPASVPVTPPKLVDARFTTPLCNMRPGPTPVTSQLLVET